MLTIITGVGARGQVGEAVAAALARRGDAVVLVSRGEAEVKARADELVGAGYPASGYACDLADADDVARLAERVRTAHGPLVDNLVNLAGGFALSGPLAESDPHQAAHLMRINYQTALLTTRAFLPRVKAAQGSIVFFASENVLEGVRTKGSAAYSAAKAAVVALMRSVSDEMREHGVRANALAPGSIRTTANEQAMGSDARYVEREDVAAMVAFLCSPASRAITGQTIRLR